MNAPDTILGVERLVMPGSTPTWRSACGAQLSASPWAAKKLAVVGRSGSGKSQTGRAILGLSEGRVTADRLQPIGAKACWASPRRNGARSQAAHRHGDAGPKYSPQSGDARRRPDHRSLPRRLCGQAARKRAMEMLEAVRIRDPERVFRAWPRSGFPAAWASEVMIAMMLVTSRRCTIADRPTSALDVTVAAAGCYHSRRPGKDPEHGPHLHQPRSQSGARFPDRVLVMYAGQIMEDAEVQRDQCRASPLHKACWPARRRSKHRRETTGSAAARPR